PQTYTEDQGEVFLGRSVTQHKQVSDVTAHVIDEEVRRVIDSNYARAKCILETNLDKLHIMAGNTPKPPKDWDETLSNKPPQAPPAPAGGPPIPAGQH
ncbi:MAG TPA: ATP-dependent metalloprotease, partial [Steroidobacteraceae bacterium]|nr:ATP-dependent metalloprotease [Steroidobacteraceae bacterium]